MRGFAMMASTASTLLLASSILLHRQRDEAVKGGRNIRDLLKPVRDVAVRSTGCIPDKSVTIEVETIKDMGRLSELLMKPILYTERGEGITLYILDDDTRYQHIVKE